MQKQMGFTLLEAITVIVITAVIAQMTSVMMTNGFNIYFGEKRILDANWQGRLALEKMARDFRAIRSPSDITTINPSQFSFVDINNNTLTFQLSGQSLMRSNEILADGVSTLAFTYFDKNGVATATPANVRYVRVVLVITQNNTNVTLTTALNGRDLP